MDFRERTYYVTIKDGSEATTETLSLTFAEVAAKYPYLAPLLASLRPDDDLHLRITNGEMSWVVSA